MRDEEMMLVGRRRSGRDGVGLARSGVGSSLNVDLLADLRLSTSTRQPSVDALAMLLTGEFECRFP